MEAQIKCPHCGHTYPLTPEEARQSAGQAITCANCRQAFTVPSDLGVGQSGPPQATPPSPDHKIQLQYATPEPQRGHGLAIASLVCGILGFCIPLIAGIIGLVLGIRALKRTTNSQRRDKKLAIAGVTVSGLSLLVMVPLIMISTFVQLSYRRGVDTNRAQCAANMRQIGQALWMYANENQDAFPPTLDVLLTMEDITSEVFVCPSSNDIPASGTTAAAQAANLKGKHLSYIYVGRGMTTTAPAKAVLLYEKPGNHGTDGCNFLFADLHVEWVPQKTASKMIADVQAGKNPPSQSGP